MLHVSDEGWEGEQCWQGDLLQPPPLPANGEKNYPQREILSWKCQCQDLGVWLQSMLLGRAAMGQKAEG